MTISQVRVTGDLNETDNCAGACIAVNSTCTIRIRFRPKATGGRTGDVAVSAIGAQATATLSGSATPAAAIVLEPLIVSFASTTINATSAKQNITISNTSNAVVGLRTPSITGDFRITNNTCGATLASSTGCTVSIVFAPSASGTRTGAFTMFDDAGTQTTSLTGIGTSPATDTLSPAALTFAPQQLGTASAAQTITLTNAGDVALTLIAATITSGDFTVVNACGASLNAHASCSISVAFVPTSVGPIMGSLSVSDTYRTQTIALSGTGVAPAGVSLSPTNGIKFPATGVGLSVSSPSIVTLTNNRDIPLAIASKAVTGDFAIVAGSDTCGGTLASNAACTMQIAFAPTAGGSRLGALTITDDATNSPHVLQLTGTGVDFSLDANGSTKVTITSGQNAVFPLLLTSASNIPNDNVASFTCTGVPLNATCNITPASVPLGTTTTIAVTVLTGVTSASVTAGDRVFWLAGLLPLGLLALARRRLPRFTCLLLLCGLIAAAGCGSGPRISAPRGSGPTPPTQVTPAGQYTAVP